MEGGEGGEEEVGVEEEDGDGGECVEILEEVF